MFRDIPPKKFALALGILAIALGFAYNAAVHPMDFRVYHYGARGVFDGTRPVYGPTSGLGWPMHYRYPPLFLLLFTPFALLPLGMAAALWVLLKFLVLILLFRKFPDGGKTPDTAIFPPSRNSVIPLLVVAPYIVEEFRYGNAQFFVFALTAAALLIANKRPVLSASGLALAISLKVWPSFFVPYLMVRREWKLVSYALLFILAFALIPAFYFGFKGNFNLLGQWFAQEWHTQLGESEIWFPNQSLRGVLMRYLTVIDYSQVPDSNYAKVNITAIDPTIVRVLWMTIAAIVYAGFLFVANRRRTTKQWIDHAIAFCLLALLEPFTQKYALAVLLWPAIAAAQIMKDAHLRTFIYIATVLVLIQPLAPGASAQRLLQVLGLDFFATLFLTIALVIPW